MPYYDSIDADLERAKVILAEGKAEGNIVGGVIYGKDIYAAYMLLKSLVEHIEHLHREKERTA